MKEVNSITLATGTASADMLLKPNMLIKPAVYYPHGSPEERKKEYLGERRMRTIGTDFSTREDGENGPAIEGYFAVFNSNYEIGEGMSESIAPGAFTNSLANDVRALTNHDTTLVLGRTKAGTLQIKEDDKGLWGHIDINPNDADAVNLYERVKRGDVDQCSFGFDIRAEETEFLENGDVHWTIKDVELYEISCCTFPAYTETSISVSRSAQRDEIVKRKNEAWKKQMKERLKNGTKGLDD